MNVKRSHHQNFDPLGKVFLSHAKLDKAIVRRLARRLTNAGVSLWLDDRELIVGDSLPEEVFKAIAKASAVIVVISDNSLKSDWVRNEIRAASIRMIKGECRLIPVVIDDSEPPAVMTGLFYADCRPKSRVGTKQILEALTKEAMAQQELQQKRDAQKREREKPTVNDDDVTVRGRGIDVFVQGLFGRRGYAEMEVSATKTLSWNVLSVRHPTKGEIDIAFDVVHAYSLNSGCFTVDDWQDWANTVTADYDCRYGLIVTERPIDPLLKEKLEEVSPNVFVQKIPKEWQRTSGALCIVDFAPKITDFEALQRLTDAAAAMAKAIDDQVDYEPFPTTI